MTMKRSIGEIIFSIFNYSLIFLLCIVTIYPFWDSLVISLSTQASSMGMEINLFPKELDLTAWKMVVFSKPIWLGFYNTVVRTVLGTLLGIVLSVTLAYPIAKKTFPHRKMITGFIVFTMLFHGGLIPAYILVKDLGLMNTMWALILPAAISPFNIIILRNFFESIPDSIEESAKMDGANDILILLRIVLPLSMPVLATVTLWVMVGHWNSWFDAVLYINERSKFVLQLILREIVILNMADPSVIPANASAQPVTTESMQAAFTMFVTIPILLVYPFLQRYFAKGIMLGGVKA